MIYTSACSWKRVYLLGIYFYYMPSKFNRKKDLQLQHQKVTLRRRKFNLEMVDIDLLNLSKRLFEEKQSSRRRVTLAEANQIKQILAQNIRNYLSSGQLDPFQIQIAQGYLSYAANEQLA